MQKNAGYTLGLVVVVVLGLLWWQYGQTPTPTPYVLTLVSGETVASWSFNGAYTGKPELVAKAEAEIARLTSMLDTKDDYEIYVSIANQYDLMGDGANELAYLEYALGIDHLTTGLAWYNAGVLFTRLGALETARMAYQKAAEAQPIAQYLQAVTDFEKAHPLAQ